jgi:phasin family protein
MATTTKAKANGTTASKTEATEAVEAAVKTGTEALKSGFEKAAQGYDQIYGYSKDTVEACVKSANVAGKGAETLHNELYSFSKQAIEDQMAQAKALMASKSVHEAFELQSDFAKSAFEAYIGQMTKMGEIFASATKEAIEPIQGRVQAWVETVQGPRAS